MAFTDTEKQDIRRYIGAPDAYRQDNTRLESAMDLAGADPIAVATVQGYLTEIAAIDARLTGVARSSGAGPSSCSPP